MSSFELSTEQPQLRCSKYKGSLVFHIFSQARLYGSITRLLCSPGMYPKYQSNQASKSASSRNRGVLWHLIITPPVTCIYTYRPMQCELLCYNKRSCNFNTRLPDGFYLSLMFYYTNFYSTYEVTSYILERVAGSLKCTPDQLVRL